MTIAGVLLTFAPALGDRTLSRRDTNRAYAPMRPLIVEALRAGHLPLWNPHEGTGKPLFAEGIHGVLHPISLLGALVAPSSVDFLILGYLLAAALGATLLASSLGASPLAAPGAGLAFALSGYSVSMTGNLVFLGGLSSLPWLLAAARSAGEGRRWGSVATALATACAFFSGDTQIALLGLGLGFLLACDVGGRRGALRVSAGILSGLLLAGVQIAATWGLLRESRRGVRLAGWEASDWSLSPWRIPEWVLPGLFRGPLHEAPSGAFGVGLEDLFTESIYLGAPLLVAAALALLPRYAPGRRRTALLLWTAAAMLVWLALGPHAGARQALDWVPIWSQFRYSEKLMAPLALVLSALAALGIDAFGAAPLPSGWRRGLLVTAALVSGMIVLLLLAPDASSRMLGEAGAYYRSTLAAGSPHLAIALAALAAIDLIRPVAARTVALALAVALAPIMASRYGAALLREEDSGNAALVRALAADAPAPRVAHPADFVFGPEEQHDVVRVVARHQSRLLLPSTNVALRVDTMSEYGSFGPRRHAALLAATGDDWARTARRFGLTHVVLPVPLNVLDRERAARAIQDATLAWRDADYGVEAWSVPHRPWAFFPRRAVSIREPPSTPVEPPYALGALLTLAARGDDLTVAVETGDPLATSPGRVLSVDRGTAAVRVHAESDGPSLLVLQDAFWRGWRATVDGRPTEILATDWLVRSVRWPGGRHLLEMTYDPPEVRAGLVLTALGALLLAVLACAPVAQRIARSRLNGAAPAP